MKIKRGISLLLSITLLSAIVMTVSADEITQTGTDTIEVSADVPVTITTEDDYAGEVINDVLGIKVSWDVGTLELVCGEDYALKWDPANLTYVKDEETINNFYWSRTSNNQLKLCSVTNLSLYDVSVTPSFTAAEDLAGTNIENYFSFSSSTLTKATVTENALNTTGTAGETKTINAQLVPTNNINWETVYKAVAEKNLTSVGTITLTVTKASS